MSSEMTYSNDEPFAAEQSATRSAHQISRDLDPNTAIHCQSSRQGLSARSCAFETPTDVVTVCARKPVIGGKKALAHT
jgi:hypothetical protein